MSNNKKKMKIFLSSNIGYRILMIILIMVLFFSILLSITIGVAGGNLRIMLKTILNLDSSTEISKIILKMRLPRALAACITGIAFSLSGSVMQGLTANPLADSGLLGINAGAGFAIALTAVIFPTLSSVTIMAFAFLGSSLSVIVVYILGMRRKNSNPIRLVLAGSAVSAFFVSLSQCLSMAFGLAKSLSFWTVGSLSGITWKQLIIVTPWITGASIIALLISEKLSILSLGEENAKSLGINIKAVSVVGIFSVLIMSGASVSLVGGISFLGLIIPHTARILVGSDYRKILPISAILGGILLVLSDIAARIINAPFDTPVGSLVSLIGVPVFILLTYQKKRI